MKTEDICKTLQDADIQNIDDAMIENVLNYNIQFASEKDVIHFFCLITHIRNNREHYYLDLKTQPFFHSGRV